MIASVSSRDWLLKSCATSVADAKGDFVAHRVAVVKRHHRNAVLIAPEDCMLFCCRRRIIIIFLCNFSYNVALRLLPTLIS